MKVLRTSATKILLTDHMEVFSPKQSLVEKIKDDLTFSNPAYASTVRYSRWSTTNVPPYLFYFSEHKGSISVPIGYDISSAVGRVDVQDERCSCPIKFPPFILSLRKDQSRAASAYLSSKEGHHLIQLPTGKGKTVLSLYIASALQQRTLILTHKDDLVKGWIEDANKCFGGKLKVGVIKAKKRSIGQVTIATVQTLNRMDSEELNNLFNSFGFVVMDEAHHIAAGSFSIFSQFRSMYKLGVTATPERSDGLTQVMYLYCGSMIYRYESTEEDSDILPVMVIPRIVSAVYFDPVCRCTKYSNGMKAVIEDMNALRSKYLDKDQKRLSEIPYEYRPKVQYQTIDDYVVKNTEHMMAVVSDLKHEFRQGHSCVLFFTQKEHVDLYYNFLKDVQHFPEECLGKYYGGTKDCDSVLKYAKEHRKFITLATYAKATEGTNCPQWEVAFLVSSINNGKNTEQVSGRIRRTFSNKITPVLVYDYRTPNVYSFKNHGYTRDRRYKDLGFSFFSSTPTGKSSSVFGRGFRR